MSHILRTGSGMCPAFCAGPMPVPIRKSRKQGGARGNEENVSAEEAPALQGAWLPQAYAHDQWPQGAGPSPRQGPRTPDPLIYAPAARRELQRAAEQAARFFFAARVQGCKRSPGMMIWAGPAGKKAVRSALQIT